MLVPTAMLHHWTDQRQCTVLVFEPNFAFEDAIGSHACSFELLASSEQVCGQWHSSWVFTPLTVWHCKLHPNTVKALCVCTELLGDC
jgi:hypothetical protein